MSKLDPKLWVLRHVDPVRLLFEQLEEPDNVPQWYQDAANGGVEIDDKDGMVGVQIEIKTKTGQHVFAIAVLGIYVPAEPDGDRKSSKSAAETSIVEQASVAEVEAFVTRAVVDLQPFLRTELYNLSRRPRNSKGIMLVPSMPEIAPGRRADSPSA